MAHWIVKDYGFAGAKYTCSNCGYVFNDIFSQDKDFGKCKECNEIIDEDIEYTESDKITLPTNKIKVGLFFEDKKSVIDFVSFSCLNATKRFESIDELIYESPIMKFKWIKPFSQFRHERFNFVFTTEEIRNTEWFDTVVRPCLITGTSAIDI